MDIQRTLLIGAAALLSFMLLSEWVAFREVRLGDSVNAVSPSQLTNPGAAAADRPGPAAAPSATTPTPDLPGDDDLPPVPGQDAAIPAVDTNKSRRIVRVFTDTLHMAISLRGGDIVEVALPQHLARIDDPDQPFVLLEDNARRTYVAQSGLIGPDGIDRSGRATFASEQTEYRLRKGSERLDVDLTWIGPNGVEVIKRFTFRPGDYLVDVSYIVRNESDAGWEGNLFAQIKRDSTPAPSAESSGMGMKPYLGFATTMPDDRFRKIDFEDIRDEPFRQQLQGAWIAMIQHYFLSAWIADPAMTHNYSTRVTESGLNIAGFTSPALTVPPGASGTVSTAFYAGPKDQYRLREISPYLDLSVDYGWLWWIAQPLFWLLTQIQAVVVNWGAAIILLTVLIKAVFFKLSATSYRSMANMRRVQPKLQDIRERYADDKQKQSQAMMDLYRKEKINPMGGCLPIVVQMPVFIALYWVLMESVELRHSPFILWIDDLSVMDPYFVLPVLMGASMWFMQKLNPPPPDPMQAKLMQWLPIIFTFFFLWFPSGLVLYWLVNNLLSMAQQYVITRQIENSAAS